MFADERDQATCRYRLFMITGKGVSVVVSLPLPWRSIRLQHWCNFTSAVIMWSRITMQTSIPEHCSQKISQYISWTSSKSIALVEHNNTQHLMETRCLKGPAILGWEMSSCSYFTTYFYPALNYVHLSVARHFALFVLNSFVHVCFTYGLIPAKFIRLWAQIARNSWKFYTLSKVRIRGCSSTINNKMKW